MEICDAAVWCYFIASMGEESSLIIPWPQSLYRILVAQLYRRVSA